MSCNRNFLCISLALFRVTGVLRLFYGPWHWTQKRLLLWGNMKTWLYASRKVYDNRLKTATIVERVSRAWNRVKRGIETVNVVSRTSQVWIATNLMWLGSVNQVQLSELITWWSTETAIWVPHVVMTFRVAKSFACKTRYVSVNVLFRPIVHAMLHVTHIVHWTWCSLVNFTCYWHQKLFTDVGPCPNKYLTAPPVWRPAWRPMQTAKISWKGNTAS